MKAEAQRIAIAEACGHIFMGHWESPATGEVTPMCAGERGGVFDMPDYLNDLNAMHEAEKTLNFDQRNTYATELYAPVDVGQNSSWWTCAHATAAQRAEAFLCTIGKWEESP